MKKTIDKSHFYSFERVWFPDLKDISDSACDITKYMRFKQQAGSFKHSIEYVDCTLITDLRSSPEEMYKQYPYELRREIKRAASEDGVNIFFYTHTDLENDPGIIREFTKMYLQYCDLIQNEELKKTYRDNSIDLYIQNKCILVSKAEFTNGKAYHVYVWDDEDCLFIYSVSDHKGKDVDSKLAGRANRLLHYRDLLWFKEHGVIHYDWGNVTSFDEPNGIDKFKMSFGGRKVKVYSYLVGNTARGKALVSLKKHVRR